MTIFTGIYSSLTGLLSFSDALNVISNDVANLNTPGYKASNVLFRDLGPNAGGDVDQSPSGFGDLGQGVDLEGSHLSFKAGTIQGTGNDTDVAIDGNGFFILKTVKGLQVFSRAGQFKFDDEGKLVDSVTGAVVQAITSSGSLTDLIINKFATNPSSPTTSVSFVGNLSTGSTTATVNNVTVIDATGATRTLTVKFQSNSATTAGSWTVTVTDSDGTQIGTGEIRFDGTGAPLTGFNEVNLTLHAGSLQSPLKLTFGTPGSTDGATSFSAGTTSTLQMGTSDGKPLGRLQGITIDADGTVQLAFSNGAKESGPQLAIANFSDPQALTQIGSSQFFADPRKVHPQIGRAGTNGMGKIAPQSIELANVDLSQEFSEIVILQRGFQGSSQVLNVTSQLLEELYSNLGGR